MIARTSLLIFGIILVIIGYIIWHDYFAIGDDIVIKLGLLLLIAGVIAIIIWVIIKLINVTSGH